MPVKIRTLRRAPQTGRPSLRTGPPVFRLVTTGTAPWAAELRVLHLIPYCIAGGVESWIRTLAGRTPGIRHSCYAPYYVAEGVGIFRGGPADLWTPDLPPVDPFSERAAELLRAFLQEHPEFDLLHCAYHRGVYHVAREDGRPVIVTVHGAGYEWLAGERAPEATVGVSAHLGGPGRRTIMLGVECERFARPPGARHWRAELGIGWDAPVALWVSRLHPTKGIELFAQVARAVLGQVPSAHVVAVGHGKDAEAERWMADLQASEPRLHWLRAVAPDNMPDLYGAADLLLHTSPYEGFGLTVCEAQAAGRPVVAVRGGGVSEIVRDGETGLLYEGDASALTAGCRALLEDAQVRGWMGDAARNRAAEQFSARRMGREYGELYRSVAARRPAAPKKPKGVIIYSGQEWRVFGGGQTTTQVARAFLRRGYEVLFVPLTSWAHAGGGTGEALPEGVRQVVLNRSMDPVMEFASSHDALWWCGLPTPEALTHLAALRGRCPTVYHVRDDWEAFGEDWWSADIERETVWGCDVVTAITGQYDPHYGRPCAAVPNAYDPEVFSPQARRKCPRYPTVIYWGSFPKMFWRDDLFRGVCERLPRWKFVLVGGYADYWQEPLPANATCLGWHPVSELPALAAKADLGIIPFGTAVSHRCHPIKGPEMAALGLRFAACGCPGVAMDGNPAALHVDADADALAGALKALAKQAPDEAALRAYAEGATWDARVARWERLCGC